VRCEKKKTRRQLRFVSRGKRGEAPNAALFHAKSAKEQRAQRKINATNAALRVRCEKKKTRRQLRFVLRGKRGEALNAALFHAKSAKEQRAQRKINTKTAALRVRCEKKKTRRQLRFVSRGKRGEAPNAALFHAKSAKEQRAQRKINAANAALRVHCEKKKTRRQLRFVSRGWHDGEHGIVSRKDC